MFKKDAYQNNLTKIENINYNNHWDFKKSDKLRVMTINIPIYMVEMIDFLKGKKDKNDELIIISRCEFVRNAIGKALKKTFKFLIDFENLKEKTEEVKS